MRKPREVHTGTTFLSVHTLRMKDDPTIQF